MATLSNIAKTAVATLTNFSKPSSTIAYLLRETGDYLLREESGKLILTEGNVFINQAKA